MTKVNLHAYDIYHLGVSGGKDSTAVLLWLVYESDLPREKIVVTFCDTGNEDPLTYAFLEMLNERVFPIQTIRPERDFWELAKRKKRFPSRKARFCTQFLKIIPSRDFILELLRENKNVLALNGVRKDEAKSGNNRGEVPEFGFDEGMGCDIYRPILDWSIEDVWAIHKRHLKTAWIRKIIEADSRLSPPHKKHLIKRVERSGIPRNPLYDMGASRVGCFPCINSSKLEIRAIARYRPEKVNFIAQQEISNPNPNGISTFFSPNTVPMQYRTREVVTSDGRIVKVAPIRDVVTWSMTKRYKPQQFEMDFNLPPASACDIGGYCE